MCSLVDHDRLQLDYKDYEISIGDREISDDATINTFEELGATINFIDIWLKLLCEKLTLDVRHIPILLKLFSGKYLKLSK